MHIVPPGGAFLFAVAAALYGAAIPNPVLAVEGFDHTYQAYAALLRDHVAGDRVDYAMLAANRDRLEEVVQQFGAVSGETERSWSREQRLAYWINAYNVFTLDAIIDHYPVSRRFGLAVLLYPANSIRQIPGVWDRLTWRAAGRNVTLDEIEHQIIRPTFKEPRIHFAVNCASVSCPPLRPDPYVARDLERQLEEATRHALATERALQVRDSTLHVSSIFDWYGEDFLPQYADRLPGDRAPKERAILAFVAEYGPPEAARLARSGDTRIEYLDYDWTLNDIRK